MIKNTLKYSWLLLLFCVPSILFAQTWDVPSNKKAEVSPFKFDASTQKNGSALFNKNCLSCHGEPGKNNSVQLNPLPGDPAGAKFSSQTDGSLFYKITNGRGLMPKFASVLKEKERWEIISYIRSFHKGYVQPEIRLTVAGDKKAIEISIVKLNDSTIEASAFSYINDSLTLPVTNVELALLVSRYFGNLSLGEPQVTNSNGKVIFTVDTSMPADTIGNNTFIISPTNKEQFGDVEASIALAVGTKNSVPALNEKRAIWNVVRKAPLWIIFTYTIGVLAVWSVLGYIIFQLVMLRKKTNEV